MQIGRFGSLVGFSLSALGAGALAIDPNAKWVGWWLIAVGSATLAGSILWGIYAHRARWKEKLELSLIILGGLAGAWLFGTMALGGIAWAILKPGNLGSIVGKPQATQDEGPLVWFSNLTLEGGGARNIFSLRFRGSNTSQKEVHLKSADITSAVNGTKLPLEIVAVNEVGNNEIVPIDTVQLIPPGAPIELVAKFNLPDGLEPRVFLETWRQFFFNATDDTKTYRHPFNEGNLMAFFPGRVGPRVMEKPDVAK